MRTPLHTRPARTVISWVLNKKQPAGRQVIAVAMRNGGGGAMEKRPLVLVVEDHVDSVEMYVSALGGAGFQVETATDGIQGLQKAMSLLPEAIVTDLKLPELDGWA